ncbi:MAG: hypothetical protein SF029_00190 [bacterium]|nr:hypothetical protein [bacterium]
MPDSAYAEIVVLCEDRQSEVFARQFLKIYFGLNNHQLRFKAALPGVGSGERFVLNEYAAEVKLLRQKRNMKRIALVILIDGDVLEVEDRMKQLDAVLRESGTEVRQGEDAVAIFIPKRNIETWIAYLRGQQVDEQKT